MEKYNTSWRLFYSIGIIGIAVQQLIVHNLMPVIVPSSIPFISGCVSCIWVVSILMIVAGLAVAFNKNGRTAALLLGFFFLLLFIALHVPSQLQNNPKFLAGWSNPLKILALSGGAFVVAGSLPKPVNQNGFISILAKIIPYGKCFFAIDILVAGIMHFFYMPFVAMLVPAWIPWCNFWGYLAGVALIAAAIGIIFNIKRQLAANLLGVMIYIWLITLHISRVIADPTSGNGNEIVSVFEALVFSGIAFLIASPQPLSKGEL